MSEASESDRLRLAYRALGLKDEPRAGWVQHGVHSPESVAAHSWGTAYLCLLFSDAAGVQRERAVTIAVLHDLAEAATGDFPSRLDVRDRPVSESVKSDLENSAIQELLPTPVADLRALWLAYEERSDEEARFVRDMNLIDMCLQAVKYERDKRYDASVLVPSAGGHRHLDEFFLGARPRLQSDLARRLFTLAHTWYLAARKGEQDPLRDAGA